MGRYDAVNVVVGAIIGSGIFLKPGVAARELGAIGPILAVWIVVGLVTLCGSLALAELASMLPHAGGPYVYLREAYGRLWGFLWGWTEFWVIRTGSIGALATATAIYASQAIPMSRPQQAALAIGLVLLLSAINVAGVHWAAWVQNLTAGTKVFFLLFLIALPFVAGGASTANLAPMMPEEWSWSLARGFGVAMVAVMWPYDGWIQIAPVAEELRQPQRNIPAALVIGVGLVIALYLGANLAYHLTLPIEEVAKSSAVAATMCERLLGPIGASLVAVGVAFSTFGAANANILTGPRIYFAMARDGLLPGPLSRLHPRFRTPMNAIAVQAIWTTLLLAFAFRWMERPGDAFDLLTDFVIFGSSIFYALTVAAVYVLRARRPEWTRPYRAWGYPVVPAIYLIAFTAALTSLLLYKPVPSMVGLGLIAAGGVVYALIPKPPSSGLN